MDANRALIAAAARGGARALVYTGSTGVFGQRDGSDVDEATPPAPASETGAVLVEAEALVRGAGSGALRACVIRLSGLYGPVAPASSSACAAASSRSGPGDDAWMNFCHRDDAVTFVLAAIERGERRGRSTTAVTREPARRREVVGWIARAARIPPPRAERGRAAAPAGGIRSERTRAALGVALAYPSFREGLAALLARGRRSLSR